MTKDDDEKVRRTGNKTAISELDSEKLFMVIKLKQSHACINNVSYRLYCFYSSSLESYILINGNEKREVRNRKLASPYLWISTGQLQVTYRCFYRLRHRRRYARSICFA